MTASKTLLYFLGGWMKHAIHLFPFYAPYVNSYKRYQTNSWAPTDLNQWAYDNRTVPFRVLGKGKSLRIEFRVPGSDVNPYLAYYAALISGLDGIKNEIMPPPMIVGNAYDNSDIVPVP